MTPMVLAALALAADQPPIRDPVDVAVVHKAITEWPATLTWPSCAINAIKKPVKSRAELFRSCAAEEAADLAANAPKLGAEAARRDMESFKALFAWGIIDWNSDIATRAQKLMAAYPHRQLKDAWITCMSAGIEPATLQLSGFEYTKAYMLGLCKSQEENLRSTMVREFGSQGEGLVTEYMKGMVWAWRFKYIQQIASSAQSR